MFSLRVNYEITANISFMDRLEVVAFNALPAALYPDATTNVYVAFFQRLLSVSLLSRFVDLCGFGPKQCMRRVFSSLAECVGCA